MIIIGHRTRIEKHELIIIYCCLGTYTSEQIAKMNDI